MESLAGPQSLPARIRRVAKKVTFLDMLTRENEAMDPKQAGVNSSMCIP
jgi:hypothetical protein